jgi:hypothetical protein
MSLDDDFRGEAQLAKVSAETAKLMAEAESIKARCELDQSLAEAQRSKYSAETEKLRAEARASKEKVDAEKELATAQVIKLSVDVEKVKAEIAAAKRFWRPESFTFAGALVVAILGLLGNIYTKDLLDKKENAEKRIAEADATVKAADAKVKAADASAKEAKTEAERLGPTITGLRQEAAILSEKTAGAISSLITQNEKLQRVTQDVAEITKQRDLLETDVAVAPIVEFISRAMATARFYADRGIDEQLKQLTSEHYREYQDYLVLVGRSSKSESEKEKRIAESRRDQIVAAWSDTANTAGLRVWLMESAMRVTVVDNRELRLRAKAAFLRFCRDGFFVPRTRLNARTREEQQIIWRRLGVSDGSGANLEYIDLQALYNDLADSLDLAHILITSDEPSESLVALLNFTYLIRNNGTSDGEWATLWAKIVRTLLRRFINAKGQEMANAAWQLDLARLREPLILSALFQHKERDAALEIAKTAVLDLSSNKLWMNRLSDVDRRRFLSLRDSISAREFSAWKASNSDRIEFWRRLTEDDEFGESSEDRSKIASVTRAGYQACASEF